MTNIKNSIKKLLWIAEQERTEQKENITENMEWRDKEAVENKDKEYGRCLEEKSEEATKLCRKVRSRTKTVLRQTV